MYFIRVTKRVFISAGEASGELYGALLSRAIKKRWPETEIMGIGGSQMKKEGVNLVASVSGSLGLIETVRHWGQLIKSYSKAKETLREHKPDIIVLIDFPDFNLALAKKAKRAGIPVLYYVSPQVWAWRSGRVNKIAKLVNRMAVLLPFEPDLYKNVNLECTFVGHPITETMDTGKTKEELKRNLGIDPAKNVVSFLPGSRFSEIKRHEPIILKTVEKLHSLYPEIQVVLPLLSGTVVQGVFPDYVTIVYDRTKEAVACSEAAAVASGTATLETALLGTPMVVFYRLSPMTFFLARLLVKVRFISLVNLISKKEIVKELIQNNATAENVFSELRKILEDQDYRKNMLSGLKRVRDIMGEKTASIQVAEIVGELAGWSRTAAALNG
ncbi:lipid-A-disaccharide synthase [bacterium]|nr:MAG: lipid-A-disaccharide synthase [bacterium]